MDRTSYCVGIVAGMSVMLGLQLLYIVIGAYMDVRRSKRDD